MTAEYFRRVSYDGSAEPTLDTLAALVAAHNRSIPFENLDPLMGIPVIDLTPTPSSTSWSGVAAAAIASSRTG